jgi:hypothetical protein
VLKLLEDDFSYRVESVAHHGDTVENMAYAGGQLDDFVRLLEKTIARGTVPKAILLSGGGNDIAGDEFAMFSTTRTRPARPERDRRRVIGTAPNGDGQPRGRRSGSESHFGERARVVLHGYDHPIPDGRGWLGGGWFLPGPWLEPGFRRALSRRTAAEGGVLQANKLVLAT